jgi:uncharacterized protein with FMN-binding domain
MRKYILSLFLVATFGVYSAYSYQNQNIVTTSQTTSLAINTVPVTTPVNPVTVAVSVPISVPVSTPVKKPIPTPVPVPVATTNTGRYKNGQYIGQSANAYYGNIQVEVTIASGAITSVQFLDYPHDRRTSQYINQQAMPILQQEAIQAQSANVDTVSGATDSSGAFQQSLSSALAQAANS